MIDPLPSAWRKYSSTLNKRPFLRDCYSCNVLKCSCWRRKVDNKIMFALEANLHSIVAASSNHITILVYLNYYYHGKLN